MTDNEIIIALKNEIRLTEYVGSIYCDGVKLRLVKDALDLINRQKEEIERLTAERDAMHQDVKAAEEYAWRLKTEKDSLIRSYEACQAEAIKEFAEKAKKALRSGEAIRDKSMRAIIDNLVKEMVGE